MTHNEFQDLQAMKAHRDSRKVTEFTLTVNDHKDCYTTVKKYMNSQMVRHGNLLTSIEELDKADYLVVADMEHKEENQSIRVVGSTIEQVLNFFKDNHPKQYEQIPEINIKKFEFISKQCKASSSLSYQVINLADDDGVEYDDLDIQYRYTTDNLEQNDIVGGFKTVEEFITKLREGKKVTSIHCYPDTPVGFWAFYGTDFKSLLDHVVTD